MSAPAGDRLFIALPIPQDVRNDLDDVIRPLHHDLPGLRWTLPEGWHLTLAFIGRTDPTDIPRILDVVGRVAAGTPPPHVLRPGAPGRFGDRVLWLGVDDEPTGAIERLGDDVQSALETTAIPVSRRRVTPHLTLARSGRRPVTATVVRRLASAGRPTTGWRPERLELWASDLGRGPARYRSLASLALSH